MHRDRREIHRQPTGQHDAPLDGLNQLRRVAVARVVGAAGVGNADDRALQGAVGVARALDESLAQKQRETLVAVVGQAF